ncbi:hypothetical protein [Corynebacterium guaraldiae]|uniref:hypothetical protein n=1 Tax=Corynebacterium guaraldiae TaxID=3051103 RepID=UPI0012B6B53C|nr:hypothetical protein [Corynebacterium guaraldiae]MTD97060.1 hypothetical protein [Corynebacterium guaraldiae]
MRNFRTAAVAAATAVTVAFGGTVVASAETANTNEGTSTSTENTNEGTSSNEDSSSAKNSKEGSSSSLTQLGKKWGAWEEGEDGKAVVKPDNKVTGEDMWGKETDPNMPEWASKWKTGVITLGVSSVIGAIIGAYNFAVYNNIVPAHLLDPIFRR